MSSVYDLKPRFQRLLRPLMARMTRLGLRPNHVTIAAVIGSVAAGALVAYNGWLWLLPLWLFARMALNAIDGMMAREFDLASNLGAVLNELGDVLSDLAIYLPLALLQPELQIPATTFAITATLTEFCGVMSRALGASRRYDGPMGKSDRAFLIGAMGLAGWIAPETLRYWPWILGLAAAAGVWTCVNRVRGALKELRER